MGNLSKQSQVKMENITDQDRKLYHACGSGNIEVVEEILSNKNADINRLMDRFMGVNTTPLIKAVEEGHLKIVRRLLDIPGNHLDKKDYYGNTALHMACEGNRVSIVKLICQDSRCNPNMINKKNSTGTTPLMMATKEGHLDIVGILLELPSLQLGESDYVDNTALHMACEGNRDSIVKLLLQDSRCSPSIVNMKNSDGITPLMRAVRLGHLNIVKSLLQHPGIELGKKNSLGRTALHWACDYNRVSIVKLLCQDSRCTPSVVNTKNSHGSTALMRAVHGGHLDIVKALDKEGTDFLTKHRHGSTLVEMARMKEHAEVWEYLIERPKVDSLQVIAAHNIARYVRNRADVEAMVIPVTMKQFLVGFVDDDE